MYGGLFPYATEDERHAHDLFGMIAYSGSVLASTQGSPRLQAPDTLLVCSTRCHTVKTQPGTRRSMLFRPRA